MALLPSCMMDCKNVYSFATCVHLTQQSQGMLGAALHSRKRNIMLIHPFPAIVTKNEHPGVKHCCSNAHDICFVCVQVMSGDTVTHQIRIDITKNYKIRGQSNDSGFRVL